MAKKTHPSGMSEIVVSGRFSDLVVSIIETHVWCGSRGFDLSCLLCPVRSHNISPSLYNNLRRSWRSYIRTPVSEYAPKSTIAGTLFVLSIRLHSMECMNSDIAARWSAMQRKQYTHESKPMKNLCTKNVCLYLNKWHCERQQKTSGSNVCCPCPLNSFSMRALA